MAKKVVKKSTSSKNISRITLGWLSVIFWIIFVMIVSWSGLMSHSVPSIDTGTSNLIVSSILLIPIGIVSFLLLYRTGFSNFKLSGKLPTLGSGMRVVCALLGTCAVLALSWWFFMFTGVVLYLNGVI